MGMYIAISSGVGWATSGGVFDCIVEGTRNCFSSKHAACVRQIYGPLDEQGQSFIALDDVNKECFNLFYQFCKQAMEEFPASERGSSVPRDDIPGIL